MEQIGKEAEKDMEATSSNASDTASDVGAPEEKENGSTEDGDSANPEPVIKKVLYCTVKLIKLCNFFAWAVVFNNN